MTRAIPFARNAQAVPTMLMEFRNVSHDDAPSRADRDIDNEVEDGVLPVEHVRLDAC